MTTTIKPFSRFDLAPHPMPDYALPELDQEAELKARGAALFHTLNDHKDRVDKARSDLADVGARWESACWSYAQTGNISELLALDERRRLALLVISTMEPVEETRTRLNTRLRHRRDDLMNKAGAVETLYSLAFTGDLSATLRNRDQVDGFWRLVNQVDPDHRDARLLPVFERVSPWLKTLEGRPRENF